MSKKALQHTPSAWNTVGPFFPQSLLATDEHDLTKVGLAGGKPHGQYIEIRGQVREENAKPAVNVILELWQANAAGKYNHPYDSSDRALDDNFLGFGRCPTDPDGRYCFRTVMPGGYRVGQTQERAPHLNLSLLGSGIMRRLITKMYFPGEPTNARDALLCTLPHDAVRNRLVATPDDTLDTSIRRFRFDIVLRGDNETPFFID